MKSRDLAVLSEPSVRVNSVAFSFRGMEVPVKGLEELVDETKKCLSDAMRNHFLRVQKNKI
ncbi:hypothetical protein AOA79_0204935 [Helicobacter pylori]|uniref:hypothetical protein n=1 Tax=Helicobacter pylori TaxID=210 RepID=UPI000707B6DC|nr:hypothetical protein [Helicobacter pylori]OKB16565.1 hypothetical protein AOD78_0204890 [Helicobacter pylori]OKB18348.1 hypothetical protein AOA79_0204935 [Helicobacter pylori]OKB21039.1 hypothetical protein AOD75_0202640 [Helicobacter pylori]